MTSVFVDGKQVGCTAIEAGPCVVTQVKTTETDGYEAIQIAFGDKKEKNTDAGALNHFAKSGSAPKAVVKELRNPSVTAALGDTLTVELFEEGEKVSIVGTSKGKGFQGVVKRHGFAGVGEATHGQHNRQRSPGSIGGASYPARVFKGMRMGGRMGGDTVKVKSLKVLKVYPEKNLILVSGSVPGHNGATVLIQN